MKITEYEVGYVLGMLVGLIFVVASIILVVMSHGILAIEAERIYILGAAIILYAIFYGIGNTLVTPHDIGKKKEARTFGAKVMVWLFGFISAIIASAFLVAGVFITNKPI